MFAVSDMPKIAHRNHPNMKVHSWAYSFIYSFIFGAERPIGLDKYIILYTHHTVSFKRVNTLKVAVQLGMVNHACNSTSFGGGDITS